MYADMDHYHYCNWYRKKCKKIVSPSGQSSAVFVWLLGIHIVQLSFPLPPLHIPHDHWLLSRINDTVFLLTNFNQPFKIPFTQNVHLAITLHTTFWESIS